MKVDASKLKRSREESALTIRELAEKAGIGFSTVWHLESGKRVDAHPPTVRKLATALGVEPKDLMPEPTP